MPLEIERKFLVAGDGWRQLSEPVEMRQGYLARDGRCTVRVRTSGGRGWLTVKSRTVDFTRSEFEFEIPFAQAEEMLATLCTHPLIEKRRSRIPDGDVVWEVDEFLGDNAGLVIAEVELASAEQEISPPDWIGEEVTGDPRYFNSNLLVNPFRTWKK